ncbi:MAG TPA: M20/M25/M40 family metallo-hydrolase [Thermoanaerobaculia bacterium]|nr:M20/M25/M40 family metallo-hydrolase [Thermoanaerobaculia bacterium]
MKVLAYDGFSGIITCPMSSPSFALRLRRAARIALYGSVLLACAIAAGLVAVINRPMQARESELWILTDYKTLPETRLLQHYVQIDTTPTTGDERLGARFLADRLAEAGIPSHIEYLNGRHANLWAILEGERPEALVLHNHIDVSSVNPSEWWVPPFEGRIQLPWIFGRGVFDMKSVAIAQLQALIDLKKSGIKPKLSVIFLATGGEEYGSFLGTQWILQQHPELVRRFHAVMTEGGTVEARTRSEIKYWGTEFAQKRFVDLVVCSHDRAPLESIKDWLNQHHTLTNLHVVPEVAAILPAYAKSRDSSELRDVLTSRRMLADVRAYRKLPAYVQSMFRNEAVPFRIQQTADGDWELTIKFHLLPGVELADVRDELVPPWLLHGLTATLRELPTARHGSPVDHPILKVIQAEVESRHPGATAGPMFLSWTATDSRFFRQAGIPSYGFSPFLIMTTDTLQVDAANERMALPGFVEGVHLYSAVLHRLLVDTKW